MAVKHPQRKGKLGCVDELWRARVLEMLLLTLILTQLPEGYQEQGICDFPEIRFYGSWFLQSVLEQLPFT